jgi:RNA polymerase sigma-70 factor, ECF subfamily
VNETTVLSQLRALDPTTLAAVYDEYNAPIYRYAYRLLGDAALAEDCTTETFSRLLKGLAQGSGPTQYLKAYLYRIAHNWIADQLRAGAVGALSLDALVEDDAALEPVSEAPSPQLLFEQAADAAQVRRALTSLTDEQRLVIVMKYFEELSNEEVAAALNKPLGAIKSLQHRGLNALRRALQHVIEVTQ